MSAIHFYRRYDSDGRCKVICMQCFQTLGMAWDRQSLEEMESGHACAFWREGAPDAVPRELKKPGRTEVRLLRGALRMDAWALIPLMVLALYAVPTALELAARQMLNPWLAVILPGDLIGCAVLAGLLRRPRTGLLLYFLLTLVEGVFYLGGAARPHELAWFADLVPTVLVVTLMLRMKVRSRPVGIS